MNCQFQQKLALNGRLIDILGHLDRPTLRQDLLSLPSASSQRWLDSRLRHIEQAHLIASERAGKQTLFTALDLPLARAAKELLRARPDVRLGWSTSLPIRILLTLPSWSGAPRPWDVAGCSESSWRHTVSDLAESGLVLHDPDDRLIVNPRLPELEEFLDVYQRHLKLVPDDLLSGERTQGRCIHRRGAEAAWRIPHGGIREGYRVVGPAAVHRLRVLVDPFAIAYAGQRELDLWDHALLYARAQILSRRLPVTLEARTLDVLALLAGPRLHENSAFRDRTAFYGLPDLPDDMHARWEKTSDPVARLGRTDADVGVLDQ